MMWRSVLTVSRSDCSFGLRAKAPFTLTHSKPYTQLKRQHLPHFALYSAGALVAYLELPLWGRPSDRHHNPVRALRETFPAPHPRPEMLHDVTIESMKVHPSSTMILASGIVHAHLI
ncbi:hypothetical protein EDB84DRAFT_570175 [Lactarius hengduanensis]|nr:hypothetical protein EDB84DRAFT_570175 [Lactarius hengduanensis]